MKSKITDNPSFTVREQIGYAGGIFGNAMCQDSAGTYADKFFRNFMGIKSSQMTVMANIHTVLNFISPTVAGALIDTPVKPGQRTPTKRILMITPVPFALVTCMLFLVPFSEPVKNFIWALVLKAVYNTVDCFYDLSLNSLSLRMTTNSKDRKNFYTVSTLASALGSMLPGWIIPIIVSRSDDPVMQKWLYFLIALVFAVLGVVTMYMPFFTLNEKIKVKERKGKTNNIVWDKKTISTLLHSRSFVVTQIANIFEQIRQISYNLLPYIYDDTFNDYGMKAIIDAISGTLSYAGLLSVPFISNVFSARTVMSGSFAFTGFFYGIMALFGINFNLEKIRKRRYIIGMLIGISGMPNNAISASKKVIIGDATDYMEWYSEKEYGEPIRSEGLITATQGILGNINSFIRANIYNIAFGFIKYKESTVSGAGKAVKVVQSSQTLKGIYRFFTLAGVIGNFLASASYLFDNYSGKRKEMILQQLEEMRAVRAKKEQLEAAQMV